MGDLSGYDSRKAHRDDQRRFAKARNASDDYSRRLVQVARHIGTLAHGLRGTDGLRAALKRYSDLLHPWAEATAKAMLDDVDRRDMKAWKTYAKQIGSKLERTAAQTPLTAAKRLLASQQIKLITNLPMVALDRLQDGKPLESIVRNRARVIAVAEVATAQSEFTQARAQFCGITHYQWVDAGDLHVRPEHRRLSGRIFGWNEPPVAEADGARHHPGHNPACRCVALPVLP